ncbi:MAG TPA: S1 family peptidase [Polyangiaceae bacterium]
MLPGLLPTRVAALATSMLCLLTACSEQERTEPSRFSAPVVDGELSPSGSEDAVLLLRATTPELGERLCGASLVAKNLVVTARHCVAYVTAGPFLCTPDGKLVEGEPGAGRMGLDLPPESLEFFTNDVPRIAPVAIGARVVSTLSDSACSNDLAFVVLDRPLELPVFSLRRGRPAVRGEEVAVVGYGAERSAGPPIDFETQRRRRRTDLTIAGVGPDASADFSDGAVPPRMVVVDGPSACLGDSGGPLLAKATNALVAVHSLIEGDCSDPGTRSFYTHLPPLFVWAERAFDAASASPVLEPDPNAEPCAETACAGAGGEQAGGAAGSSGEGTSGASSRGGAGGAIEPPEPETPRERTATREKNSGCASAPARSGSLANATALLLVVLARRARRTISAARRAGRLRPAASAASGARPKA